MDFSTGKMTSKIAIRFTALRCLLFVFAVTFMGIAKCQEEADNSPLPSSYFYRVPLYQNFLTEFRIVDSALDYNALRDQVLVGINQLQISLESVKTNLQLNNVTIHSMS